MPHVAAACRGTDGRRRENDNDYAEGSLTLLFQRYINPDERVAFCWGAGPTTGVNWSKYETRSTDDIGNTSTSTHEDREFYVGAKAVLGAECFLIQWISLHAEYYALVVYGDGRHTDTEVSSDGNQ